MGLMIASLGQWDRIESPEIKPCIYGQLIFNKVAKNTVGKGLSLQLMVLGKLDIHMQNNEIGGLPWWCSGLESACQCRGHRFEPWSWKIPHAAEQLSLHATTTESAL